MESSNICGRTANAILACLCPSPDTALVKTVYSVRPAFSTSNPMRCCSIGCGTFS